MEGFEPKDIFNLDETALFYRLLPNKTLCNQAKASGTKTLKDRVSVVFCASFTGEKLTPWVIGKAAKPRCFKGLDLNKIGVKYVNTYKSWMTSVLFNEYLKELNAQMVEQKRKILLLVDNTPLHIVQQEYSNIKVEFLPKNTTSALQPLDQGIIRSFKAHYKTKLIKYLVAVGNDTNETVKTINLGVVINWIGEAWNEISEITITNCFKKSSLFGEEPELLLTDTGTRELQAELTAVSASASLEEYLDADNIDLTYDCDISDLNKKIYERVH